MSKQFVPRTSIAPIHGYWDRPRPKDFGEKDVNNLFRAVGEALGTWENVEHIFSRIFGVFVESTSEAAFRAYGVIASHSGRREALESAAKIYFATRAKEAGALDAFNLLVDHLGKASARRNEIAHSTPMTFRVSDTDRGFFSVPAAYNARKTTAFITHWRDLETKNKDDAYAVFGLSYRYTADDIMHFVSRFQLLQQQATELLVYLIQLHTFERTGQRAP
ncbi:MAG TPA: hypothetical protein VJV79_30670 [Polyangiaceae bacterium]|nr:hypothetical protein [Polyangiaceae bacterium]